MGFHRLEKTLGTNEDGSNRLVKLARSELFRGGIVEIDRGSIGTASLVRESALRLRSGAT
jgi:hypothetical protein